MEHGADVGLVDAHAKGDGAGDDGVGGGHKPLLHLAALLGLHAGVVGAGGQAGGGQAHAQAQLPEGQARARRGRAHRAGGGGLGRESVAVTKGIWGMGDFLDGPAPYDYIGDGTQNGVKFWTSTPAVKATQKSENGRNTFQPNRINWS